MLLKLTLAALAILGAAICATAQNKVSTRPGEHVGQGSSSPAPGREANAGGPAAEYFYEFEQPDFVVNHVEIRHDAEGRGTIRFWRRNDAEPITDPLEVSPAALARIRNLYETLRFLDSDTNYQAKRDYPSFGKTRLRLSMGGRERATEFNYPGDPNAMALMQEYRRLTEQAVFVFEIKLAVEMQPLEAPKLMSKLETLLRLNQISDPKQLAPLIRALSTDERLPLIARNHATRLLPKLEK